MALFSPDYFAPGDDIGHGIWLNKHALEHIQFVQLGLSQSPPVFINDYDMFAWDKKDKYAQKIWLEVHETVHAQLRATTGVSGLDLSEVDFDNRGDMLEWLDAHAQEHAQIRAKLGIL
jgi:hypothetical protein